MKTQSDKEQLESDAFRESKVSKLLFFAALALWVIFQWFLFVSFTGSKGFNIILMIYPAAITYGVWKCWKFEGSWYFLLSILALYRAVRELIDFEGYVFEFISVGILFFVVLTWLNLLIRNLKESNRMSSTYGLASLPMVQLRDPLSKALQLYGEPKEKEKIGDAEGATRYVFEPRGIFEVIIIEWQGIIHTAVYTPMFSMPDDDLRLMKSHFGGERRWNVMTEGYYYITNDDDVRLWCSAMPPIGVDTKEFREHRTWDAEDD